MMFDKELFLSLCEKYGVEFSETATKPMIRRGEEVHAVSDEDVSRIFIPCHTYFDYSLKKNYTGQSSEKYSFQEDLAVAC